MANDPHFIEHMHMHKGAFGKKAQAAGKSTAAYAAQEKDAPGKTGAQARLAQTLMSLKK